MASVPNTWQRPAHAAIRPWHAQDVARCHHLDRGSTVAISSRPLRTSDRNHRARDERGHENPRHLPGGLLLAGDCQLHAALTGKSPIAFAADHSLRDCTAFFGLLTRSVAEWRGQHRTRAPHGRRGAGAPPQAAHARAITARRRLVIAMIRSERIAYHRSRRSRLGVLPAGRRNAERTAFDVSAGHTDSNPDPEAGGIAMCGGMDPSSIADCDTDHGGRARASLICRRQTRMYTNQSSLDFCAALTRSFRFRGEEAPWESDRPAAHVHSNDP